VIAVDDQGEAVSEDLRELLKVVHKLPCIDSRRLVMRTLRSMVGRRLYIAKSAVVAPDRLELALSLLATRGVAATREALMIRLSCGKTTAYKLISAALQARAGR